MAKDPQTLPDASSERPERKQRGGRYISITGPKEGRRRAGRDFGPTPVILALSDLSEKEAQAIIDDPLLHVGPAKAPEQTEDGAAE